jgi:phage-related minor tail protein
MSKKDLKVTLIGDDKTGKAFGSASSGAAKFSKLAIGAIAAVGAAAAGAGVALFKIGGEFDKSYDTIRVGTGATGKALDGLKDDFRDVVANVPTDFKSASTAIADLNTRTGQTGEPLRQLSKQMLEMTRLTGGDLSANIASVTRVFGDWGIAAKDQSGTMDYLFKVSQTTGIGIDQLSQKVVQFGAPLRQMGFDFETSAAMLGKWEKEGVNTEAVLAGMKVGLGNMAAAGKEPVEAMREVSDAIKNAGSTGEATSIAMEVFGKRAGPDMAAAIREGRFDLDALMGTLKGSKETILGAAADTMSFSEKWQMFKNQALLALEPIATRVFTALGGYLDRFGAWWSANGPAIIATATTIGATISSAFSSVAGVVQSAVAVFQRFQPIILSIAGVIAAVFVPHFVAMGVAAMVNAAKTAGAWVMTQMSAIKAAAVHSAQVAAMVVKWAFVGVQSLAHAAKVAAAWLIAIGPIGLVIAAVVGLVALVVKNWDTIRQKTVDLWNAVKDATSRVWDALKTLVSGAVDAVRAKISDTWNAIKTNITGALDAIKTGMRDAWESTKRTLAQAWDSMKQAVTDALAKVVGWVGELPGNLLRGLSSLGQGLFDLASGAWRRFSDAVRSAAEAVLGYVRAYPGNVASGLSNLGQLLWGVASGAWSRFREAVSGGAEAALGVVRGVPGRIVGALGNLGSLLVNAGRELMSGLARGIGEKISAVIGKVREAAQKIKNLLPGSPVKDGPLRAWNNGGAGKRLMDMLAGGIQSGAPKVGQALERAVDFGDLAGMHLGGAGYINQRLASTSASAPTKPVGITRPNQGGNAELIELLREQNALLRAMPREYRMGERQGLTRG